VGRSVLAASVTVLGIGLAGCGDKQVGSAPRARSRPAGAAAYRATPAPAPAGAFQPDPALFPRKHAPGAGDWIAVHRESVDSFEQYVEDAPTRPNATRRVIVLQPIGPFSAAENELLETLSDYLGRYFQLETRIADELPLPTMGMRAWQEPDKVVIIGVSPNGPAARAEIRPGDVILAVAGEAVTDLEGFYSRLWGLGPAGVTAPLTVQREMDVEDAASAWVALIDWYRQEPRWRPD